MAQHPINNICNNFKHICAIIHYRIKEYFGYDYDIYEDVNKENYKIGPNKTIEFTNNFNRPMVLNPHFLIEYHRLSFGNGYNQQIMIKTITHLTIHGNILRLHLTLGKNLICLKMTNPNLNVRIVLTKNLYSLWYESYKFNSPITSSKNLRVIRMGKSFNEKLDLPKNMIYLKLGYNFNHPVTLPKSLKYLRIGNRYNKLFNVPKHLDHLFLSCDYNERIFLEYPFKILCFGEDKHCVQDWVPEGNKQIAFIRGYELLYIKKKNCMVSCSDLMHVYFYKTFSFE